ncbi:hypothetical protein C1I95_25815 [Micromonospora craterilacus]|uniref:DNA-binding protein n=1 Tax=Micromonospora craterilacus TaxID=1655439 RepID=A0A2W2EJN0_9ACTN|nr:hypothetical protein [Micromonospora craterilacus]PZG12468.1 hypothetical protein C1I95_25815 [Micromonospora craterilacus]
MSIEIPDRPLTLPEVAQVTGLSLRLIERGCRKGAIEHTPKGEGTERVHRIMYPHQVRLLLESRQVGVTKPVEQPPADPIQEAIEATRAMVARQNRRHVA